MNLYELRAGITKPTKMGRESIRITSRHHSISGTGWDLLDPRMGSPLTSSSGPPHTRTKNSTFACETDGSDQKPDSESFRIAFGADPAISPDPIPGWDLRDHRLGSPGPDGISGILLVVRRN